jgi:hypothetical protein
MALAAIPLATITGKSFANVNAVTRIQVKYQDQPLDGKSCAACLEFIPGKSETDLGGCKKIPEDSEISPNGYCTLWNTM